MMHSESEASTTETLANLLAQEFHDDAKERTVYKLTTLLIGKLAQEEPFFVQQRIYDCIFRSKNKRSYSKCVEKLLKKHRKKLMSNQQRQKREVQRKTEFKLADQIPERSIYSHIVGMLYDFVHNAKKWFGRKSKSQEHHEKFFKDQSFMIQELIESFLQSPLVGLRFKFNQDHIDIDMKPLTGLSDSVSSPRILSPRVMPMTETKDEHTNLLSPDILSLYSDSKNPLSFSNLIPDADRESWFQFFKELAGVNDMVESLNSGAFLAQSIKKAKISTKGVSLPVESAFEVSELVKVGDIYKLLSIEQLNDLNQEGYSIMTNDQIDAVYKNRSDDIGHLKNMEYHEKELFVLDQVGEFLQSRTRKKRTNDPPCISAPFIGGTSLITYLMSPQILCPAVFSYIILGPLVLSPYVLSPYILAPYILSPQVLTPIILSPYALSPNILVPAVLSPLILNPYVLSPDILSPTVLSPTVLSPNALSPLILSPGVLSPPVLSPNVLSPALLSPCVLCRRRKRSRAAHSDREYRFSKF